MWEVSAQPYDGPLAQALVAEVQAEYVVRYGSVDEAPVDPMEFLPPNGLLLIASVAGKPVAMGGFRLLRPGLAEIKRMYVPASERRKGWSRRMLAAIEEAARESGVTELWLNTGAEQPEAVALYRSSGYETIDGFGHYADAPLAIFFGKRI